MTTIRVALDGTVTHGVAVPHEAANIQCYAPLGTRRDPESGITYALSCKQRAGHDTPKGEKPHVPVDHRIVASPPRISRTRRFAPSGIPKGVDQNVTVPHDCGNHLLDVAEVNRGF